MNQKFKMFTVVQIMRLFVQILFFILLPALFIQALNGVKQLFLAVINQDFNLSLLSQMVEVIVLIPFTMILGRFFCGWMCGFGSFTDFIYLIASKFTKKKFRVHPTVDKALKKVKYIILIILIIFAWSLNLTIFNSLSPWDVFGMTAIVGNLPDFKFVLSNLPIAFVFFALIIIGSMFIERFFCRYLCPMGAVFAISSILRIGKIKKPRDKCGNCRICTNHCPMGISLYETDIVSSTECIDCMKCISVCPRKNTAYTVGKKDIQPLLVSAVSVAVMTSSYYTIGFAMGNSDSSYTISQESGAASTKIYSDGTYQGTGTGFRGTTTVSVTIKDDKITNITTVSTRDDQQYYQRAFSTVTKSMISSQSPEVDAVAGATYSSNGIMQAVTNALNTAKESTVSNQTETTSSQETASASTSSITTTTPTSATSSSSSTTEITSQTSSTSNAATSTTAPNSTTAAASTGQYKDGTYTGSGTGFKGTTKVSVVVTGGKITDITTVSSRDDKPYYNRAFSTITANIKSTQTYNVDTVSGATFSSKGIIQAVQNALSTAIQ